MKDPFDHLQSTTHPPQPPPIRRIKDIEIFLWITDSKLKLPFSSTEKKKEITLNPNGKGLRNALWGIEALALISCWITSSKLKLRLYLLMMKP